MKIFEYIKDKLFSIIIILFSIIITTLLLIIFDVNSYLIIIILFLDFCSFFISFLYEYLRKKRFYNYINKKLYDLDQKYLINELIKSPNFIEGNILKEYLYEINKSYIESINKYKIDNEEFKEYIELWCHEIKTPITTSKLIIENNKIEKKLENEINSIEGFVEQVLYYARSGNPEKDYIISKINLKDTVDNVIKRNKFDLINKKIRIKSFKEKVIVESDSKWLEFIINQIINNSIKYESSKIEVEYTLNENNVILSILDNGLGIPDNEISKVFDKGFTGSKGRTNHNSTGIGLYLCKKLCVKLGHNIFILSKENEYTKVFIVFPSSSLIKKVN